MTKWLTKGGNAVVKDKEILNPEGLRMKKNL